MSKKEIPEELQEKLEKFEVEVPVFEVKRKKIDRFANWIYAPAANPLEFLSIKENSVTRLVFTPFVIIFVLSLTPVFLM